MPFPLDGFCFPAMNRHRLHDSRMIRKSAIHACFPDIRDLLASGQRAHGPVFLQCNGVLRGADLTAVVEGEQENQ